MILNLYKERGETPLECIQRFVAQNPDLKGQKMTYMGRLDPLAEGVLLIGTGEDVYRKEEFLGLDKEYDFVSIFGFATDSFDVLGKILRVEKIENINELDLIKIAKVYEGEREQKYPFYSSKMISKRVVRKNSSSEKSSGRPSQSSGLNQTFSPEDFSSPQADISTSPPLLNLGEGAGGEVPEVKKITIHELKFLGLDSLSNKEFFGRLLMDISKVKGDFRQNEILILWNKILEGYKNERIFLGKWSAHVSSGTYIRSLVNDFGNTLGMGATTLSIKRTRAGEYKIEDSIKF